MRRLSPLLTLPLVFACERHEDKAVKSTDPSDSGSPVTVDTGTPEVGDTGTGETPDSCDGNPDCEGTLLWALQFGDTENQAGSRVSSGADGTIALNGEFQGTMDLGLGELQSNGGLDSFWARLDSDGTASHTMSLGTTAYDLNIFDVGPSGVVVFTGTFEGALQLGDKTLESAGDEDIVLAAFDPGEGFLWSQRFGDEMIQHGGEVLIGETGEVTITGYIDAGTVDFGGGPMTVDEVICGNYMARFGPDGEHRWSVLFEGVDSVWGATIALLDDGGIVLAGEVFGTMDLGGGSLSGGDDTDVVVGRFDADGQHLWSHRYADPGNGGPWRIVADPTGDIVVMGYADGEIDFGGGTLSSIGPRDIFLVRFDGDGEHLWSRRFGGTGISEGFGLAMDPTGNIVLGGWFQGSLDLGCETLVSEGGFDGFVARLDGSGACTWSQSFGDETYQWVDGVATDESGNVLATGAFAGSMVVGDQTLTSVGGEDGFLLKLSP